VGLRRKKRRKVHSLEICWDWRLREVGYGGLDMLNEKNDSAWVKCCMWTVTVQSWQRKTWWDCVKDVMKSFGLSREDAQDKDY